MKQEINCGVEEPTKYEKTSKLFHHVCQDEKKIKCRASFFYFQRKSLSGPKKKGGFYAVWHHAASEFSLCVKSSKMRVHSDTCWQKCRLWQREIISVPK